jgi:hypothetical protein
MGIRTFCVHVAVIVSLVARSRFHARGGNWACRAHQSGKTFFICDWLVLGAPAWSLTCL